MTGTVLMEQEDQHLNKELKGILETDLHIHDMIAERNKFKKLCSKSRLYKNPTYKDPWKIFSLISLRLENDILVSIENDFAPGIEQFVKEFLKNETNFV